MPKAPNYLSFLVAVDDHFVNSSDDYIQDSSVLHRIARDAGLETAELPQAARWTGELYVHDYLRVQSWRFNQDVPLPPFTDQDIQGLGEFRITPSGREEAERVRRGRREAATNAVIGLRFPDLEQLASSDAQRRAVENPFQHLREGLDQQQWDRVIGSAKDLLEAACKVAIAASGREVPSNESLQALLRQALASASNDGASDDLAKRVGSVTQQLAEVRNTVGTGHGRDEYPLVTRRAARLAAETALAVASYLLGSSR